MGSLQEKSVRYGLSQQIEAKGVYPCFRCIESEQNTEMIMSGRKVLMFGSNLCLGLVSHPKVIGAAVRATCKYGIGCAESRFLNGTLDLHLQLEKELAESVSKKDAIIYSTGFQVNLDVVSRAIGRKDHVICDELDHASIVEGYRLPFSIIPKFKYNNMESLEKELQKCRPDTVKLIIVDGVFSMEGDIANLPEIARLPKKYDANIIVNEAHGSRALDNNGRGTCDHLGLAKEVDPTMGTFSKSLAAIGGFIVADEFIINYLCHNPHSYVLSVSNISATTVAARTAPQITKNEPGRIEHLWGIINYSSKYFRELGFETGHTSTPIIPLYARDMERMFMVTKMLFDEDAFVNSVTPPVHSPNGTSIHLLLIATYSKEQIGFVIGKLVKCLKALDLL